MMGHALSSMGPGGSSAGARALRLEIDIDASAPFEVRRLVGTMAAGTPVLGDALLLASEITTNAILHGSWVPGDRLCLIAHRYDHTLRITVIGPGTPNDPGLGSREHPGGFGLGLVDSISSDWAMELDDDNSTRVWFELNW